MTTKKTTSATAKPTATTAATPKVATKPRKAATGGPGRSGEATTSAQAAEPVGGAVSPAQKGPREGTKQAQLIDMLRNPAGATIEEMVAATGWQSHTVRGALVGALKKKLRLDVTSEKIEGRGRVYRISK